MWDATPDQSPKGIHQLSELYIRATANKTVKQKNKNKTKNKNREKKN